MNLSPTKRIPAYLTGKNELTVTVLVTVLFSVVYLGVRIPFTRETWFFIGPQASFTLMMGFLVCTLALLVESRRLMYLWHTRMTITFLGYALWICTEVLAVSLLYTGFTEYGRFHGMIDRMEWMSFSTIMGSCLANTFTCIALPAIFCGMYFTISDRENTIRLMNYSGVVSDEKNTAGSDHKVTLFDNSGQLKLSVSMNNLFYIESDDNYVLVWYEDSDSQLKQYMLRCRLKTIEESFMGSDLQRCHRKYIVNMSRVKVLRKEKDSFVLVLDNDAIPSIPITKTYEEKVLARFNERR